MCSPILDSGNPSGVLNTTEQLGIPSGWNAGEDPKGTDSKLKIQTLKELSESGGQYVIGEGVELQKWLEHDGPTEVTQTDWRLHKSKIDSSVICKHHFSMDIKKTERRHRHIPSDLLEVDLSFCKPAVKDRSDQRVIYELLYVCRGNRKDGSKCQRSRKDLNGKIVDGWCTGLGHCSPGCSWDRRSAVHLCGMTLRITATAQMIIDGQRCVTIKGWHVPSGSNEVAIQTWAQIPAGSKDAAWKGNSASRQLEKKRKLELAKRPIDQVVVCQAPVQSPKRHKSRHSHSALMPGNRRQLAEREILMLQEESRRQHEAELKMQNDLRAKLLKSGIQVDTASDEAARVQESSTTTTAWHSSVACLRVLAWLESAEQMSQEEEVKDSSTFPTSV
mmetsp:Transcript_7095/g.16256  ORF Transcript_7095/g.16256 Transcript_7095/m.16256 type:complete len:389 (-) Transcript_7095:539-1705(-)